MWGARRTGEVSGYLCFPRESWRVRGPFLGDRDHITEEYGVGWMACKVLLIASSRRTVGNMG